MNVCGLATKCTVPEFLEFVKSFDILGIQESKLDDTYDIDIPGYRIFYNNRDKLMSRRSGGIALFVKNDLVKYVTVDQAKCSKLVLWFTVSHEILQVERDVILELCIFPRPVLNMQTMTPLWNFKEKSDDTVQTPPIWYYLGISTHVPEKKRTSR